MYEKTVELEEILAAIPYRRICGQTEEGVALR